MGRDGQDARDPARTQNSPADDARTTGRGFLVITGAKAWFFVSAAVLNFGLPLLFATPADYGTYGVVINAVSLLNMVVITGTLQAVAKLISERPEAASSVIRRALILQLGVGLPLAGAYFALADPIAAWLHDPTYAPLLRLSGIIVVAYAFYAIFVGYFNGLKSFTRQASLDIIFATLRTIFILGAVGAGLGVAGAVGGFALAAVIIMVIAALWVWKRARTRARESTSQPSSADSRRLLGFLISTMVYTFVLNSLIRIDLFALKRYSALSMSDLGVYSADASNTLAGAYNLMLNISRVPYQAVIAVAFVIFPLLSRSTFENDHGATRDYIRNTMRYTLMIIGAFASVLAVGGADIVRPIYPDYAYATEILAMLCGAYALFSLTFVATTMLIAAGRPWLASGITASMAVFLAVLSVILIEGASPGAPMLEAAAVAVAVSMAVGLVVTGISTHMIYGAFMPLASGARLVAIAAVVVLVGIFTDFSRLFDLVDALPALEISGTGGTSRTMLGSRMTWFAAGTGKAIGLGVLYLLLLMVSGEIGPKDRARLGRVLGRRKKVAAEGPPQTGGDFQPAGKSEGHT